MKISKTLLGGVALLGTAGIASAQTPIYVTGSTAFRASATNEINNLLNANGGGYTIATDTAGASAVTSANAVTWTGGNIGGTPVTIKVSWSGSGAGVQSVAGAPNFTVGFLPNGATGTNNADPRTSSNPHDSEVPDITLSDVFQITTPFNKTFGGVKYAQLTDNTVGIVAFTFAASTGFPTGQSMTPQLAGNIFLAGYAPLSTFTGNAANTSTGVIATGRNIDSGTRITALAETNVGVNSTVNQYQPTVSGSSITALNPYPATTVNGVPESAGDGGESSGGTLRGYLTDTVSGSAATSVDGTFSSGGYLVTYLGMSDFNVVSGTAVALNYCGVAESQTAIEQGSYTFWSYEHLDYLSTITGIKKTFATRLTSQIQGSTDAALSPNVSLNAMQVSRPSDGGPVSSNND